MERKGKLAALAKELDPTRRRLNRAPVVMVPILAVVGRKEKEHQVGGNCRQGRIRALRREAVRKMGRQASNKALCY